MGLPDEFGGVGEEELSGGEHWGKKKLGEYLGVKKLRDTWRRDLGEKDLG